MSCLENRQRSLQQCKHRLQQFESSANELARKQRTRRLITLGGLVAKAQLEDWQTNTLFGALLFLKEKEADAFFKNAWTFKGCVHFAAEMKQKTPATVTFPEFPNEDLCHIFEILGLRWNAIEQQWKGQENAHELRVLLTLYGGEVDEF